MCSRNKYIMRRDNHLCVRCGEPKKGKLTVCDKCHVKLQQYYQKNVMLNYNNIIKIKKM